MMRPTFTNTLKSRNVLIFLILAACLVAPALLPGQNISTVIRI